MDQQFIDVIFMAAKVAPVIAVLWLAIRYFLKKEKGYQKQIVDLQTELRSSEKDNLQVLNRMTSVLDRLIENSSEDRAMIIEEIKRIHKDISKKIDSIK